MCHVLCLLAKWGKVCSQGSVRACYAEEMHGEEEDPKTHGCGVHWSLSGSVVVLGHAYVIVSAMCPLLWSW